MRFLASYQYKDFVYWLIKADLKADVKWFVSFIYGMYGYEPINVKQRKNGHYIVSQKIV